MVLEVNLDYFIGKSEHDSVSGSHPFLDIDHVFYFSFLGRAFFGWVGGF